MANVVRIKILLDVTWPGVKEGPAKNQRYAQHTVKRIQEHKIIRLRLVHRLPLQLKATFGMNVVIDHRAFQNLIRPT